VEHWQGVCSCGLVLYDSLTNLLALPGHIDPSTGRLSVVPLTINSGYLPGNDLRVHCQACGWDVRGLTLEQGQDTARRHAADCAPAQRT
jgi:hypothetical protein